jgi:hypothetical protein
MGVDRQFDDAADEMVLSVDNASIRGQLDSPAALFLRDVPPEIGLVGADIGQIIVKLATDRATKRHAPLARRAF